MLNIDDKIIFLLTLEHYGDCVLNTAVGHNLLNTLRGQHVHIWQENESAS